MSVATIAVDLVARTEQFKREMSDSVRSMQQAGRDMQRVGTRLSATVTAPILAIGAASIEMAIDAEESANKFNVVMGESADDVRRRFEELHKVMPLTLSEMETLAAGVQDLLVPLGLARDEAAMMSAEMLELAGDIASFNNVTADVPLEAFKSALAGQSRPLRQFGVDVSQARLEVLALEEGLISQGEAMDAAARAQAIMRAVVLDSADAIGDMEDTVNSSANSIRRMWRDVRELGQMIGAILIPAVIPLVQRMNEVLQWALELDPAMQQLAVVVAGVAAAVGPLLIFLGTLLRSLTALGLLVSPAGVLVVGLTAVATLLTIRWVRAKAEATRATREFEDAVKDVGRELRTMGEEAARVTFAQFQRSVLETRAEVERLEEELKRVMAEPVRGRGLGAAHEASVAAVRRELRGAQEELERQERLLQEARVAFFELSEGAREAAEEVGSVARAGGEASVHIGELALVTMPELTVQTREWANEMERVGPAARQARTEIEAASEATDEWAHGVLQVASGFRGILGSVARIVASFMVGGPWMAAATAVGETRRFHTGGFMAPNSMGIVRRDEELVFAGAGGAQVIPPRESARAINLTVNVPPARDLITMTRDAEWRRAIDESIADARDRGSL